LDRDDLLQAAVLLHGLIGNMRAQDGVDGKLEFSARVRIISWGFALLFMVAPWCGRSSLF
jgi:hypothetical protein